MSQPILMKIGGRNNPIINQKAFWKKSQNCPAYREFKIYEMQRKRPN